MKDWGYVPVLKRAENQLGRIFGASEALYGTDTYQFNDYSKYIVTVFDEAHKAKRRKDEFPNDCKKAFEMGVKFATDNAIDFKTESMA